MSDSIVNASLWFNVEVNVGIVSACLPTLHPLFRRHLASAFRAAFSKSGSLRDGTGSQRLTDEEGPGRIRTNTAGSAHQDAQNIYQGRPKEHGTWYNHETTAQAGKGGHNGDSSQEEMIPVSPILRCFASRYAR